MGYISCRTPSLYWCKDVRGFLVLLLLRAKRDHDNYYEFYRLFKLFRVNYQAELPDDDLSENPLDNVELRQDQLQCFPYLCKLQPLAHFAYLPKEKRKGKRRKQNRTDHAMYYCLPQVNMLNSLSATCIQILCLIC